MKAPMFLLFIFCFGLLIGLSFTPSITGQSTTCVVENVPCTCDGAECVCGEESFPLSICKDLNNAHDR